MNRRATQHFYHWVIARCGYCGHSSHWATDGRNLFCAFCKH